MLLNPEIGLNVWDNMPLRSQCCCKIAADLQLTALSTEPGSVSHLNARSSLALKSAGEQE